MAKAPAFQLYARDVLTDRELQKCDWITRGIWFHMLCWMWLEAQQGVLIGPNKELCKSLNVHHKSLKHFLKEATMYDFCDLDYDAETGVYTIKNRRMWRDSEKKRAHAEAQARYRAKQQIVISDNSVTPPSATASATASAVTVRDVSQDAIPEGPKGWMAVACTLTLGHFREEDFEAARKNAAALFARHGNTASEVLTVVHRGPPQIKYPSWLLKSACKYEATETEAEHVARVTREEGWDD